MFLLNQSFIRGESLINSFKTTGVTIVRKSTALHSRIMNRYNSTHYIKCASHRVSLTNNKGTSHIGWPLHDSECNPTYNITLYGSNNINTQPSTDDTTCLLP